MPAVTRIAQQQKRKDRYSIYLDGKYRFSLSENQLIDSRLKTGDTLSEAVIETLVSDSDFGKVLDKVYNYLSYRIRSRAEIETYLRRKKYDEKITDRIIHRLEEQKYIDDHRFATEWVENRQLLGSYSKRKLQAELRQKGISSETIEEVLAGLDSESEIESVTKLIEDRDLTRRYPDQQKLIAHLAGKGYNYGTIKAALERLL